MAETQMKSVHVPLPESLYRQLYSEAERIQRPATELVREAIDRWLAERRQQTIFDEIQNYACSVAGTQDDLDIELESAAIECLLSEDEQRDNIK